MRILLQVLLLLTLSLSTFADDSTATSEEKIMVESIFFEDDEAVRLLNPTMPLIISHQMGKELNAEKLMEDSNELMKRFPEYEDVTVRVDPGKDEKSVILVFEFQRKRMVESVRIIIHDGAVENNKLTEKLRTTKGKLLRGTNLNADKQMLKDEYLKMGYPNVEITQQINIADEAAKTVHVILNVLPKSRQAFVQQVIFSGNKKFKKFALLKMMKVRKNLWYLLDFKRRIFDVNQLAEDIKLLIEAYHDQGFANVKIESQFALTDHKNKKKGANTVITLKIDEGEQFKVQAIKVEGLKEFKVETIRPLIKYKLGTFYSGKLMRQELQKVREFYGERGFAMARVLMDYQSKDGVVTIKIDEGKKHIIDEIKIVGNLEMKESIILRDVTFVPGQIVNVKEIRKTLTAMQKTGYYDDVRVDYQPKTETSGAVIIQVAEASNHYIEFGGGYSSVGFGGEVSYNNPNLFNTGKAMSILGTKSEEMLRLAVMYNDPHLFGTNFQLSTDVHYDDRDYDGYSRRMIGTQLMIGKMITDNLKLGLGTRIEFVNVRDVAAAIASEVVDAAGNDVIVGMVSTLVYKAEKLDESGDVYSGFRLRLVLMPSYADQGVYLRSYAEIIGNVNLGTTSGGAHHVLTGRITLGYASENAPFYEKFFNGGMGTIRGFGSQSIAPASSSSGMVGGNFSISGGLYYSFPVWKNNLKGVVFVEAATVGNTLADLSDVRVAAGFGLRANLKNTFLRNNIEAGVAFPLLSQPGDDLKPFYFMIGDYNPAYDL